MGIEYYLVETYDRLRRDHIKRKEIVLVKCYQFRSTYYFWNRVRSRWENISTERFTKMKPIGINQVEFYQTIL